VRKEVPLKIAYRMLGPGPVVLVSSLKGGRAGITPIAWTTPFSDDPPIVALEIWKGHFIHKAILETKDFVINIPSSDMAETVRRLGGVSGAKVDKFKEFGLVKEKSKEVKSPRLKDAIGILECKLHPDKEALERYSVIIGDVVFAEAEETVFSDRWMPEKAGPRIMQHLGGKIFCVPDRKLC
jgi:flavin reductase (DIM6/NTAB) family NADH-FMN oxidoreductase RutF